MLSRLLREFLFALVNFVVNVIVAVQNVYYNYVVKKNGVSSVFVCNSDIEMILDHVPKMRKKLNHLVILADINYHSMDDLARLVIWSLIAGIPFLSFYDITGELKLEEDKLFVEIERKKKGIPGCIKWPNKPNLNGYSNGSQVHTIVLNIFSRDDGRPKIVQCVQEIAAGEIPCHKESEEFSAQEFGDALKSLYASFPDPDLVLYTGSLCCSYGLIPWHIRLAEFIELSLNHNFSIDSYLGALYKYNKCDQRFGK